MIQYGMQFKKPNTTPIEFNLRGVIGKKVNMTVDSYKFKADEEQALEHILTLVDQLYDSGYISTEPSPKGLYMHNPSNGQRAIFNLFKNEPEFFEELMLEVSNLLEIKKAARKGMPVFTFYLNGIENYKVTTSDFKTATFEWVADRINKYGDEVIAVAEVIGFNGEPKYDVVTFDGAKPVFIGKKSGLPVNVFRDVTMYKQFDSEVKYAS